MRLGAGRGRPTEGRATDHGAKHNARPVWSELNWQKLQANACGAGLGTASCRARLLRSRVAMPSPPGGRPCAVH